MTSKCPAGNCAIRILSFATVGLLGVATPVAISSSLSSRFPAGLTALAGQPAAQVRATANTAVGEAFQPGGNGYWAVYPDGTVASAAPATGEGDLSRQRLARPIEATVATPGGGGYWLVASDGGVFGFGDAHFYGSAGGLHLDQPVVGMAPTPDGGGYWLVARDGGIFTYGDARFYGSAGGLHLDQPVVGMAPTPDGHGYWLVAADGGIFTYGDARFYGSAGGLHLDQPVVGMAPTPDGHGYWLVARDGGIFTYGDARFHGSAAGSLAQSGQRAVGVAGAGQGGYWIETSSGTPLAMGAPLSAQSPAPPAGSAAVRSTQLAPNQDPPASQQPSASFQNGCLGAGASPAACDSAALQDINSARAQEGYGPLALPAGYGSMSVQAQLVAVADAERTSRGLPAFPENASLDQMAQRGAQQGTDPTGPSGYGWASNWAENYPTALSADYVWMYDDGTDSPNIDCTSTNRAGCWGHRRNILSPWSGRAGAGVSEDNGALELTQLFAESYP